MKKHFRFVAVLFLSGSCILVSGTESKAISDCKISEEEAIQIAIKNGIKKGIDPHKAVLIDDNIWEVRSLLCDRHYRRNIDIVRIDATSGKVLEHAGGGGGRKPMGRGRSYQPCRLFPPGVEFPGERVSGQPYRLTNSSRISELRPAIAHDGKRVVFEFMEDLKHKIAVAPIEGEDFRFLCEGRMPTWSHDDQWIAFERNGQILKHNISTAEEVQITQEKATYMSPCWSPNGRWIAYTSTKGWERVIADRGKSQDLWVISPDGKNEKSITKERARIHSPSWSSTDDTLYFYRGSKEFLAYCFDTKKVISKPLVAYSGFCLGDIGNTEKGVFPYIWDCKIVLVDAVNMVPLQALVSEPGRYWELVLSADASHIVYTSRIIDYSINQIWVLSIQ